MKKKIRINITVDEDLLSKSKKKLNMFGGKLSTLFNAYLADFISSMEKNPLTEHSQLSSRLKELEDRIKKLEKSIGGK